MPFHDEISAVMRVSSKKLPYLELFTTLRCFFLNNHSGYSFINNQIYGVPLWLVGRSTSPSNGYQLMRLAGHVGLP